MVENLRASGLYATNAVVDLSKLRCQEKPGRNVDIQDCNCVKLNRVKRDRMLFAADAAK